MNKHTLAIVLTETLQACLDGYAAAGVNPPASQYVTHGQAVWQGEQLTVACSGFRPVAPNPLTNITAPKSNFVPAADISVEMIRSCWPQPHVQQTGASVPAPDAIMAAALTVAMDAAIVGEYLARLSVEGGMFPSLPQIRTAQDVAVGPMTPLGPQGGLVGYRLPITVKLAIP